MDRGRARAVRASARHVPVPVRSAQLFTSLRRPLWAEAAAGASAGRARRVL